jgi:hypothetical protein
MNKFVFSAVGTVLIMFSMPLFATTAAVNYFENKSKNSEYEFLSTVLPNSLASTLEAEFDINTLKPAELEAQMKKDEQNPLKRSYTDIELPKLMTKIDKTDFFIYGSFQPLDDSTLEVVVNIYDRKTMEILSFSTTGRFSIVGTSGTEIFTLVDKLSETFKGFISSDQIYYTSEIQPGSKLAFITNLDAESMNRFYGPFLEDGYGIISVQSNELENHMQDDTMLWKLKYLAVKKNSFEKARSLEPMTFQYSPAFGKRMYLYQQQTKNMIKKYFYSYPAEQETVLKNLNNAYKNHIDYLFIVMFDSKQKEAWLRCFDLKRFDAKLIWLQTGIRGNGTESDKAADIAKSVLLRFSKNEGQQKKK